MGKVKRVTERSERCSRCGKYFGYIRYAASEGYICSKCQDKERNVNGDPDNYNNLFKE